MQNRKACIAKEIRPRKGSAGLDGAWLSKRLVSGLGIIPSLFVERDVPVSGQRSELHEIPADRFHYRGGPAMTFRLIGPTILLLLPAPSLSAAAILYSVEASTPGGDLNAIPIGDLIVLDITLRTDDFALAVAGSVYGYDNTIVGVDRRLDARAITRFHGPLGEPNAFDVGRGAHEPPRRRPGLPADPKQERRPLHRSPSIVSSGGPPPRSVPIATSRSAPYPRQAQSGLSPVSCWIRASRSAMQIGLEMTSTPGYVSTQASRLLSVVPVVRRIGRVA